MKYFLFLLFLGVNAHAIEVVTPKNQTAQFIIKSPDETVTTLGKVDFIIDFVSSNDSLKELKIRRQHLMLADGRPVTVYAYNEASGTILGATHPIAHISISAVQGKKVMALFYNEAYEVVAPDKKDIQVFSDNFKTLSFDYQTNLPAPSLTVDVSILIDRSGSIGKHMPDIINETRNFMQSLPDFTRCHVFSFGSEVTRLTPIDVNKTVPCAQSLFVFDKTMVVGGATALYAALDKALQAPKHSTTTQLIVVVTDGINTVGHRLSLAQLNDIKLQRGASVLVFWAGDYKAEHLQRIANYQTASTQGVKQDLDRFFSSISTAISGMQTLRLH